jgi:hypothetical protein
LPIANWQTADRTLTALNLAIGSWQTADRTPTALNLAIGNRKLAIHKSVARRPLRGKERTDDLFALRVIYGIRF